MRHASQALLLKWLFMAGAEPQELVDASVVPVETLRALYPNINLFGPDGNRVVDIAQKMMRTLPHLRWETTPVTPATLEQALLNCRATLDMKNNGVYRQLNENLLEHFKFIPFLAREPEAGNMARLTLTSLAMMHLFDGANEFRALVEKQVLRFT